MNKYLRIKNVYSGDKLIQNISLSFGFIEFILSQGILKNILIISYLCIIHFVIGCLLLLFRKFTIRSFVKNVIIWLNILAIAVSVLMLVGLFLFMIIVAGFLMQTNL